MMCQDKDLKISELSEEIQKCQIEYGQLLGINKDLENAL